MLPTGYSQANTSLKILKISIRNTVWLAKEKRDKLQPITALEI